jgi:hypothetical protein
MTVVRIIPRKVDRLPQAGAHVFNPENGEEVVNVKVILPKEGLAPEEAQILEKKKQELLNEREVKKKAMLLKDLIKVWESNFGAKRLRKDAGVREIVIAFEEGKEEKEVLEEFRRFLKVLKKEIEFIPLGVVVIHKKEGRYHLHYIASLRDPWTRKKVNLARSRWFRILDQFLDEESRKRLKRGKTIGNIPLWLIRKISRNLEEVVEKEKADKLARELVRILRRIGVKRRVIFELGGKQGKELIEIYKEAKAKYEELKRIEERIGGPRRGEEATPPSVVEELERQNQSLLEKAENIMSRLRKRRGPRL